MPRPVVEGKNDLASQSPGLAAEFDLEANFPLTPETVGKGSPKKIWWKCLNGHTFFQSPNQRTRGGKTRPCGVCSGETFDSDSDLFGKFPDLEKYLHPKLNTNFDPKGVSPTSGTKVWWLCDLGHEYSQEIRIRTAGAECPYCAGRKCWPGFNDLATLYPELAQRWDYRKNEKLPGEVLAGARTTYWLLCDLGHSYAFHGKDLGRDLGCGVCSGHRVLEGFNDLKTVRPDLAREFDLEENDPAPEEVYFRSKAPIQWKCGKGHTWTTTPALRVFLGTNCPICSNQKIVAGVNDLATLRPDIAAEWDHNKNKRLPSEVGVGAVAKAFWICSEGHSWKASIGTRQRSGCPTCSNRGFSQAERAYLYLLRKDGPITLQQFGITNQPEKRLATHRKNRWELLDVIGPVDGVWILETETALGRFFREKGLLLDSSYPDHFDGYTETWRAEELAYETVAEMLRDLRAWEK